MKRLIYIALLCLLGTVAQAQTVVVGNSPFDFAAGGGGGPTDCESAILALSPEQYLRLGESSGTTAADASGNGNTGTYDTAGTTYSATALVTNAGGDTAVDLAGTGDDGVDAGLAVSSATSWTALIFYDATDSDNSIITKGTQSRSNKNNYDVDIFYTTSTNMRLKLTDGTTEATGDYTVAAHDAGPYMLVITWDGTEAEVFIDAASEGTLTPGFTIANRSNWWAGSVASFSFVGTIDEFALWTSVLSPTDITSISTWCQ